MRHLTRVPANEETFNALVAKFVPQQGRVLVDALRTLVESRPTPTWPSDVMRFILMGHQIILKRYVRSVT